MGKVCSEAQGGAAMERSLQVHFSIPTPKKALRDTVPAWREIKNKQALGLFAETR